MADPQPWWWVAGGAVGGWLAKLVSDFFGYKTRIEDNAIQREVTALQGFKDLSTEHRADMDALRHEMALLHIQHNECKGDLTQSRRDLDELRHDLTVLQGLVVTQITVEATPTPEEDK